TCADDDSWCIGALAAFRVFFAYSTFHILLAIITIRVQSSTDCRASIQDGWWLPKYLFIIGLIIAAFFIPNPFFVVWGWISLFGAAIFIIIQIILLIDFSYVWADSWLNKYEKEEGRVWYWLLLGCTIAMYLGSLAMT